MNKILIGHIDEVLADLNVLIERFGDTDRYMRMWRTLMDAREILERAESAR